MNVRIAHPTGLTNFSVVHIDGLDLYFSYETCIAFHGDGKLVIRENDWGPTTGKHLNYVENGHKGDRVPGDAFEKLLSRYSVDVRHNE